jgi:hypothetical protein
MIDYSLPKLLFLNSELVIRFMSIYAYILPL